MKRLITMVMLAMALVLFIAGCLTRGEAYTKKTLPDGTVIESRASIVGTGDKASEVAAEGLFADGTDEDLGAGFKQATAKQQSTGIDGTLNGIGQLMTGMANFMAASQGIKVPAVSTTTGTKTTEPVHPVEATTEKPTVTLVAAPSALTSKVAEAKATGKPLVVIAGNAGCGYCAELDRLIDADTAFLNRSDIVLYRETSPWADNQAGKWTGGGEFPVLRVTQWDANGNIVCDKKVNRPQSVADIEAAMTTCKSP